MRFEKWQALGNDYIVVEQAALPWELTPGRIRRICAPHFGCACDGILLICEPAGEEAVARLRIFNPDGSEAELSGNGAREATMYLRRSGWTDDDEFAIETLAGVIRPTIISPTRCSIEMGRARLRSDDFTGAATGVEADGRRWEFVHVSLGNPHAVVDAGEKLEEIDLAAVGPQIERSELFPNRTNVEFIHRAADDRVRARIWERGVGETLASGTGASASAVAAVLKGTRSPVTVSLDGGELEIEVSEDLDVRMTGPAQPVFSGELSAELVDALHEEE